MRQSGEQVLGREARGPIGAEGLDAVPWGHGETDAVVDFYELTLTYRPKESLIESKSLKLYLWSFRDRGIFAEDLAATLLKDLVAACEPDEMTVNLTQQVRGGLQIQTVVRHPGNG